MRAALCLALLAATSAFAASPAVDYALNCQGCHLDDGAGTPGSVPPLAGSVGRFMRVEGGREYLVQVPGVATSPLDDAALAAVLNWMLERFGRPQAPERYAPYTAAEVGALRAKPLTNVERVRAELLGRVGR
jgi:mono/diheme cytochrome c family protein